MHIMMEDWTTYERGDSLDEAVYMFCRNCHSEGDLALMDSTASMDNADAALAEADALRSASEAAAVAASEALRAAEHSPLLFRAALTSPSAASAAARAARRAEDVAEGILSAEADRWDSSRRIELGRLMALLQGDTDLLQSFHRPPSVFYPGDHDG